MSKTVKSQKNDLVPLLRFPEFRQMGPWTTVALGTLITLSTEKVGDNVCVPMSITSGIGLVSQEEKFGRIIAGDSYKNYLLLRPNDFAYNKSATKEYPEGFLTLYSGSELAAVPNSIFTCFRIREESPDPQFLNYLFQCNLHGRWLRRFIQVGARAHGSLSINDSDLMALPVPLPAGERTVDEQQKIADCLSSLDALIAALAHKIDALKVHKKGMIQQLFPREGETVPRLRFPEFRGARAWERVSLGKCLSRRPEYGINAPSVPYSNNLPTYLRITDISDDGCIRKVQKVSVAKNVTEENYLEDGDIVLARTGASVGKAYKYRVQDGRLVFAGFLIRVRVNKESLNSEFLFQFLSTERYWRWVAFSSTRSGQPGINGNQYASLPIPIPPSPTEQKKIAECLSSLDALVSAHSEKLDALKSQKKGLMQQLFPVVEGVMS